MVNSLDDTDVAVLQHVARYRLTLAEILAETDWSEGSVAECQAALERLCDAGWLARGVLRPGTEERPYYQLTPRAARQLGHTEELAKPLPLDARIEWFAIAKFCCQREVFRQLFTKAEFQAKFKQLWFPGQPVRYYLEPQAAGAARLAFLKVDAAGGGRWDRLIDSCSRFLRQRTDATRVKTEHHSQVAAFARLVQRGDFQFSVLTALAEKKRAIEIELERRQGSGKPVPPITVYVVPGLWDVLFPLSPD